MISIPQTACIKNLKTNSTASQPKTALNSNLNNKDASEGMFNITDISKVTSLA